jgi:hypothetical protein
MLADPTVGKLQLPAGTPCCADAAGAHAALARSKATLKSRRMLFIARERAGRR